MDPEPHVSAVGVLPRQLATDAVRDPQAVLVPDREHPAPGGPAPAVQYAVGVDGSQESGEAAAWACSQLVARDGLVLLVAVEAPHVHLRGDRRLRRSVDLLAADLRRRFPDLAITSRVVEGEPGPVLVHAARDADLLVLGSRRLEGVVCSLLGSAAAYCLDRASCPTVVVPMGWAGRREARGRLA